MDELKHDVRDTDAHFTLKPETRELVNNSGGKPVLIQGDKNSERFTFEIPRVIEGHDMSLCDFVHVHFINIEAKTKAESKGVYKVKDLRVNPADEGTVLLSWLISGKATAYNGSLNFILKLSCRNVDGDVDYTWNTATYTKVSVGKGIDNGEAVAEDNKDILADWEATVNAGLDAANEALNRANQLVVDFGEAVDAAEQLEALKAIIEVNEGRFISWWFGTREQYEEQQESLNNVLCFITDDATYETLKADVAALKAAAEAQGEDIAAIQAALPVEESGTWTPTLENDDLYGTGAETQPAVQPTYTVRKANGYYHRFGEHIYVTCDSIFELTDAGVGWAKVGGLPFAAKEVAGFISIGVRGSISAVGLDDGFSAFGTGCSLYALPDETDVKILSENGTTRRQLRLGYDSGGTDENCVRIQFSGVYVKQ